jgi:hypothetical protein
MLELLPIVLVAVSPLCADLETSIKDTILPMDRARVEIDQSCAFFVRLNIMVKTEFVQCSERRLSDMGSST